MSESFQLPARAPDYADVFSGDLAYPEVNFLDAMPIIQESDNIYASGMADKHLDFMITVEKSEGPKVSITTQIWFNKTLGKLYLIAVLPFHKAILKHYIRKLGKPA